MEFWGVEVAPGKSLTCNPGDGFYLHASQAALGESKSEKGNARVLLKVAVGKTEVVVGTLSHGKCDQMPLDLIFDQEFKLSHTSNSSSVFFCGYKTDEVQNVDMNSYMEQSEDESDEEEVHKAVGVSSAKVNGKDYVKSTKATDQAMAAKATAKTVAKEETQKAETKKDVAKNNGGKLKTKGGKIEESKKVMNDQDDEDEEDDEIDDSAEDDEMGEDSSDMDSDDEEDDEDDEDESGDDEDSEDEEETPKSTGGKRLLESKMASVEKKMKIGLPASATKSDPGPKKIDTKMDTPNPVTPRAPQSTKKDDSEKKTQGKDNVQSQSGKGSKTPGSWVKTGRYFCEPCRRNFANEPALGQHNKAKHGKTP